MYSDCEIPEFYNSENHRAKVYHKCCECTAKIIPGEVYLRSTGKWAGDFNSYAQHVDCADACMMIRDGFQEGECIGFGCLKEWWHEDNWTREKKLEHVAEFRKLYAKILKRERRKS